MDKRFGEPALTEPLLYASPHRARASRGILVTALHLAQEMSQFRFLGLEVFCRPGGRRNLDGYALCNTNAGSFEGVDFLRIVRHQPYVGNTNVT
jgi:hypothetical protein